MTTGRNGAPWPSVSVVIVTQARDAFLRRAIRSVVSQRYPGRLECVVVFDQSSAFDLSDVAPADGGDRTLRVIENVGTPGPAGARNGGAERAFGDVLSFCRAGDEWLPGKVAHQIAALEATGADVAATGIERPARGRALERGQASARVSPTALLRCRAAEVHPSTIAVRREAFHTTIGPFDEAIPGGYGDEYDWLLRAAVVADLVAVREALVRVDRGDDPLLERSLADDRHDDRRSDDGCPGTPRAERGCAVRSCDRTASGCSAKREAAGARHRPRDAAGALAVGLTLGHVACRREPALGGVEIARGDRLGVGRGDAVEGGGSELHTPDIDRCSEVP